MPRHAEEKSLFIECAHNSDKPQINRNIRFAVNDTLILIRVLRKFIESNFTRSNFIYFIRRASHAS